MGPQPRIGWTGKLNAAISRGEPDRVLLTPNLTFRVPILPKPAAQRVLSDLGLNCLLLPGAALVNFPRFFDLVVMIQDFERTWRELVDRMLSCYPGSNPGRTFLFFFAHAVDCLAAQARAGGYVAAQGYLGAHA